MSEHRDLKVVQIREPRGRDCIEVLFLLSPQIFELDKSHPSFDAILGKLKNALEQGQILTIECRDKAIDRVIE